MHVVLQGRLEHFGARTLLVFIAANAREGTFDAQSGGDHARLAFRDGQVVAGEATGAADPIDVVAKLLQWSDGMFTFLDEVVLPEGAVPVGMEVVSLIAAADERIAEARRIVELFPDDGIRFRVANRPPGEINMTAEEFQILFQIGSGKSLAQLKSESGRTAADLYPIIKRLQMTGLVESAGDPDDTAKDAPKASSCAVVLPAPAPTPPPVVPLPGTVLAPAFVLDAAPPPAAPTAPKSSPEPQPVAPATPQSTVAAPAPATVATAQPQAAASGGPTLSSTEAPLVATLTADDGTMHPLLEESLTIGRTAANAIALRDPSVSAKHARIIRSAEGFAIEDIGSRNGTYVNSEKLTEKRLLVEGDLVRLGKIILTFNLASEMRRKQSTEREMMP
jgi:pSer/pThr/pTyr-binding forkhead associated (FHA) protein